MTYTLYAHQKAMLDALTANPRFLLLAEAGAMKTLPCLVHLSNLYMGGEIEDALVVAPLSGLGAWQRDMEKLSPDRRRVIERNTTFVNYDKLSRKGGSWQKKCWKKWGAIFLDEGHAIAKPTSNRTKYFVGTGKQLGLLAKCDYFVDITGTLLNNSRLEDAWAPLRGVLGEDYMTWGEFKAHHLVCRRIPGTFADMVIGYRNREELMSLLSRYSYRITLDEALDLPDVLPDEVITVPWTTGRNAEPFAQSTRALYDEALDSYVDALDMVMDNPLTRRLRIRQIATGHIKESDTLTETGTRVRGDTHHLNSEKTRYAMELIENNLPRKTVVGYQFRATCAKMEAALERAKISYRTLNGDTKDKNVWREFQRDDTIKVFLVQYQSGSEAIDLYAAHRTILMEPMDSSRTLIQFRGRTMRNGQKHPCSYVWLLTEKSIEFDMYNRLAEHRDFDDECWREVAARRREERR